VVKEGDVINVRLLSLGIFAALPDGPIYPQSIAPDYDLDRQRLPPKQPKP